ncbi:MAG: GNAT family N-acetyltransferase [Rikenellaceae bacterium]
MYIFDKIDSVDHPLFATCWQIYNDSFPLCERRDESSQRRAMQSEDYHFEAILRGDEVVGFVGYWIFGGETLFLEHIAISSSCRGGGVGGVVMERLQGFGLLIVGEIEPMVDEITRRRCDFYLRHGFVVNGHAHRQPPFREGEEWLPLVVISHPRMATEEEYERFRRSQIEIV